MSINLNGNHNPVAADLCVRPWGKPPLSKGGGPKGRGDSAACGGGFLSERSERNQRIAGGRLSLDAPRPNSPYPRAPVYGGRIPEVRVVATGAGDLLKAAAPYSLPLSPISGADNSTHLQRASMMQYTPFPWGGAS